MKTRLLTKGRSWVLSAAVLAGLVYSLLALTVTPKVAYATSCDCAEEHQDALEWCAEEGMPGLETFQCPTSDDHYIFTCTNAGEQPWDFPCGLF